MEKRIRKALSVAGAAGKKSRELAEEFELDKKGRAALRELLSNMLSDGKIVRIKGARYRLMDKDDDEEGGGGRAKSRSTSSESEYEPMLPAEGRIRVHPDGFGFVVRDDNPADVFVAARHRGPALDGDKVRLVTWIGRKGTEGRVVSVLARGRGKLTGIVRKRGQRVFLDPDDPRIEANHGRVVLEEGGPAAKPGQCVVAEIITYPTERTTELTARIVRVLGDPDDPRTEVAKIITIADVPQEFPDKVAAAGKQAPSDTSAEDLSDRLDLRDRPFLTIDPVTARDFDDAVCVEPRGDLFRLWVAVADVSHYVQPDSVLDLEARERGTSVYLPDRAIPMLPHELSSGICSLNPEQDRLAMVVRMDIDLQGNRTNPKFCAAIIRSHARLDYPGVAAALGGDFRGPLARYKRWTGDLENLSLVAQRLRKRRDKLGTLHIDLPEPRVILDEDDPLRVRDVVRSKAAADVKVAYQLVEEMMLAANFTVAEFFRENHHDCVWRVHDVPDQERLEAFAALAQSFGIHLDERELGSSHGMQKAIAAMAGKNYARALNFMLLRSLKQATYDVINVGHFGLGASEYLHFTSPIRRYPDVMVHRLLRYHLRKLGQPSGAPRHPKPPPASALAEMASRSSTFERRAVGVERQVVDMYRAYMMRDRVGEVLPGTVSAITGFGVFVEIEAPFVEGLIKLDQIGDDFYEFDERLIQLRGRRSGHMVCLGDPVRVRVENVSVTQRRIDLSLVGSTKSRTTTPARHPRKQRPSNKGLRKGRRKLKGKGKSRRKH